MLRLSNITKTYKVADTEVAALKGLNLSFRRNEFVSILGASGCGKTTTLNIIGGLDKYTSGDLFICGRSTKNFTDRDWDIYRNHRIGFIFQSYNLIPHQTILGNVELALTISGIHKKERQEKAKRALDRVGLKDQYYKKPNQLSGGQCQRVAIARALVNEPEILLADEPTGALDSVTSVQIMDLIKEISNEKLVIMVTHNPELAEKYSTRIVRLSDGVVLEDSNPFSEEDEIAEDKEYNDKIIDSAELTKEKVAKEQAKMSILQAFKLSSKNLYSKLKRTIMVALAGSIGIVGVSIVLGVSNGVQNYISSMENDMLSGNPVYISSSSLDYGSLMGGGLSGGTNDNINPSKDRTQIFINSLVQTLYNMNGVTSTNKITKEYMEFLDSLPEEACELIQYKYGEKVTPNIYTNFKTSDGVTHKMSIAAIQAYYSSVLKEVKDLADYASMISSVNVMSEMPSSADYISKQYEIVYIEDGLTLEEVLSSKESLVAVASKNSNTLNDLELGQYGYFSQEQFLNYCYKIGNSSLYNPNSLLQMPETMTYERLASQEFTWYPNNTVFTQGTSSDEFGAKFYASAYADGSLSTAKYSGECDDNYRRNAFGTVDGMVDLQVKCVLRLKDDLNYGCLTAGGLYYTNALTNHMRDYNYGNEKKGISQSTIVSTALSDTQKGNLYNIEMGYLFKFDGDSRTTVEKQNLSSSSNAIMDYIAQFMGASSDSGSTTMVSSYAASALGGAEYPSNILFYCEDFNQKDKLTTYLDLWNNNTHNHFKVDTNGFYLGHQTLEDGSDLLVYYYYDRDTNKYYEVEINNDGYVEDVKGNQYILKTSDSGDSGFYVRENDTISDKFELSGSIKVSDNYNINVYTFASYVILGKALSENNTNYSRLTEVPDKGGVLYSYVTKDGETEYFMKVQDREYYEINLDKDGNVISKKNGYERFRYDKDQDKFYSDTYTKVPNLDPENTVDSYILTSEEITDLSKVYASEETVQYPNCSNHLTYMINDTEYTLDTKGLYIDLTSLGNIDLTNLNSIHIDTTNHIVTLKDYSKFKYYYEKKVDEVTYTYYRVKIDEDGYLVANDILKYIDIDSNSTMSEYVSDRYKINSDGTLQAVKATFSDSAATLNQMIDLGIIGDELTDLSILEKDDSLKITYTDMIGLIISMVNTLIDIITYALIAFTALSLLVSTVMIGIITYVSVVERVKEIGVIRSLGGRKRDVSHLFNVETFIIGLSSGVLGIGITYLLSFVINMIIGSLSGIYTIASLPWYEAIIMIIVSILLTSISGIIPANAAAKKDPVVALRSE